MQQIKFIEICSEIGAGSRGGSLGIGAVKIAALNSNSRIFNLNSSIKIESENQVLYSDNNINPYAHYIENIYKLYQNISLIIKDTANSNFFPIVLSGDHSTAGATISGLKMAKQKQRLGVVWVDAHADCHSPYTTPSGNMHGMPLCIALNEDNLPCKRNEIDENTIEFWNKLKNIGEFAPKILPQDIVYIALRSFESEEKDLIERLGIKVITVEDLRSKGAKTTVNIISEYLTKCDSIYISFDMDSLDESIAKGTGTKEPNGLTEKEANILVTELIKTQKVNCLEISELNPTLDENNNTAEIAFRLINDSIQLLS